MLFIHGGGVSSWLWKKQTDYFQDRYHCIAVDLPDHGESRDRKLTGIKDAGVELLSLIKQFGRRKTAAVIGHSLGAKIAVFMSPLDQDGSVERCLIASAYFGRIAPVEKTFSVAMLNLNRFGFYRKAQVRMIGFGDHDMEKSYHEESKKTDASSNRRIIEAFAREETVPEMAPDHPVPTLVLAGSEEGAKMRLSCRKVLAAVKNGQGCLLKGCHHLYPVQNPGLFNDVLDRWMNGKSLNIDGVEELT